MFKKNFEIFFFKDLTAIKFNSFQRKSINTLNYDSMGEKKCLSSIPKQQELPISLMTMKTTIYIGKNKKLSRKVREESVQAKKTIRFSPKTFFLIQEQYFLGQLELPISL